MEILKKRQTAILVLIFVIVLGIFLGTRRSFSSLRSSTEEAFYEGTDGSGYGIATNLKLRVEYARNLIKISDGWGCDAEADALEIACQNLENAETADEKFDANTALTSSVTDLSDALTAAGVSGEDESERASLTADIESYEMRIDKLAVSYNAAVRSYNHKRSANPIAVLVGVKKLEEYA